MRESIVVSVIIPNYNYGKHIKDCVESVISSDFDPTKLEIVIVDDASTDNSVSIINNIKKTTDVKINLITKKVNSGLAKTRNLGIKQALGNYLFFLDSDNFIRKDCLKNHYDFLSSNLEYTACYAPIQRFDDASGKMLNVFSNESYDYNTLCLGNYIDAMSMIKKTDLVEIGLYDENMSRSGWEDYELWLRIGNNNKKVHFIKSAPLTYYRVHKDSMINTMTASDQIELKNYIKKKFNLKELENNNLERIDSINPIHYTSVKIFWSNNDVVFSEEKSVAHQTALSWSEKTITLQIPSSQRDIEYIRFDIGEQVGLLNIHAISIRDSSGNNIWEWNPNDLFYKENIILITNRHHWNGKTVQISTNNDPQFIVRTKSLTNEVIANGHTIEITLSTLDSTQFNLLNRTLTKPLTYISEEENAQLITTIDTLIAEKEKFANQYLIIELEKENCKKTNADLLKHIETQTTVINELNRDKGNLTVEKAEQARSTIKENEENEKAVATLENHIKELTGITQALENALSAQIENNNQFLIGNERKDQQIIELENRITAINKLSDEVQRSLAVQIEKNNQFLSQTQQQDIKISELEQTIITTNKLSRNLEITLAAQIEKHNQLLAEELKLKETTTGLENQVIALNKILQESQSSLAIQIEKNSQLLTDKEKVKLDLIAVDQTLQEIIKQNAQLLIINTKQQVHIEQIASEKHELNVKQDELTIQLNAYEVECKELKLEIISHIKEKERLDQLLFDLNKKIADYQNENLFRFINHRLLKKNTKK